jgi:hypothetical protein
MPAIKKSTSKSTKSPAPAKTVAPAAKPAKPATKSKAAPKVKAVATRPLTTSITAQIDIGFGNQLYLRGEGPGLSWDRGVLMNCVSDTQWQLTLAESARPIVFKFLVNDLSWSAGVDNYTAAPGASVVLTPTF